MFSRTVIASRVVTTKSQYRLGLRLDGAASATPSRPAANAQSTSNEARSRAHTGGQHEPLECAQRPRGRGPLRRAFSLPGHAHRYRIAVGNNSRSSAVAQNPAMQGATSRLTARRLSAPQRLSSLRRESPRVAGERHRLTACCCSDESRGAAPAYAGIIGGRVGGPLGHKRGEASAAHRSCGTAQERHAHAP
jgi:hypothetical protein